jgi:hypothetical protein
MTNLILEQDQPKTEQEQYIKDGSTLLYTYIPTLEDFDNNIPVFSIYEHDNITYCVTHDYIDGKYQSSNSFVLESTIGSYVNVELIGINNGKLINGKVDTGAACCSLDAKNIQIDDEFVTFAFNNRSYKLKMVSKQQIQTADGGVEERPVVQLTCKINNDTVDIQVNLNDRSNLEPFLIGMNLIDKLNCKIDPNLKEFIDQCKNHLL